MMLLRLEVASETRSFPSGFEVGLPNGEFNPLERSLGAGVLKREKVGRYLHAVQGVGEVSHPSRKLVPAGAPESKPGDVGGGPPLEQRLLEGQPPNGIEEVELLGQAQCR